MMQYIVLILLLINSMNFLMMNHPLSLGFSLMMQTILISLFSGIYTYSFWFSYSLFLIFMGGMLILFMYMTSLASNETFNLNMKFKYVTLWNFLLLFLILLFFMVDFKNLMMETKKINMDKDSLMTMKILMEKNKIMLNKMYNFPMNLITILLVLYLFLTLIMSVKITNIFKGPLRTK